MVPLQMINDNSVLSLRAPEAPAGASEEQTLGGFHLYGVLATLSPRCSDYFEIQHLGLFSDFWPIFSFLAVYLASKDPVLSRTMLLMAFFFFALCHCCHSSDML